MSDQTGLELEKLPKEAGPVECLGLTFENDNVRREHFLKLLSEKLRDPEFRATPGFPKGSDEDILRLSDPPYYTACPNPFLGRFLEMAAKESDSDNERAPVEPFSSDVSVGKNSPEYAAYSYHTKVPPHAVLRYILHYTQPGDVILDGFCGTGMTGVAAHLAQFPNGNLRKQVESELGEVAWGPRHTVLCDLTPLATFISANLNRPVDRLFVQQHFEGLLAPAAAEYGQLYETVGTDGLPGIVEYCVWSDVYICSNCGMEICFWDVAVDLDVGRQLEPFACASCGAMHKKRQLKRAYEQSFDTATRSSVRLAKRKLVLVNYRPAGGSRTVKKPDDADHDKALLLRDRQPPLAAPLEALVKGERYYRDGLHLVGLDYVHRFYFPRTLHVLSFLWGGIEELDVHSAVKTRLKSVLTSMIDRNLTIRNRFVVNTHNPKGRINGPLANTLYVPGLSVEQNPLVALRYKLDDVLRAAKSSQHSVCITTQDASQLPSIESSVDYVFVDPPFGNNIMYSELNQISESWLGVLTEETNEAVVSDALNKDIGAYLGLLKRCFRRFFLMLKPGRWMTVEFHNSQEAVWNAIQEAIGGAGFVVANVRVLDKKKGTINQEHYKTGTVKVDLVISAYKPRDSSFAPGAVLDPPDNSAWQFIEEHLGMLPTCDWVYDELSVSPERLAHLLFDRMVAFHVQRGWSVPLSAADFYNGLEERFPVRDRMFFLPSQIADYDASRRRATELRQLELFVFDEDSAVLWAEQRLGDQPRTFQELQPAFMQDIKAWAKHEKTVELRDILKENFLRYDGTGPVPNQIHAYLSSNFMDLQNLERDDPQLRAKAKDRWYVPDPGKQADLERLREQSLLKEFEEYRQSTKKLKEFRTEAVRAGFKACYDDGDYETIVAVGDRLPGSVLQEDEKLLMYYDVASMRMGGEV